METPLSRPQQTLATSSTLRGFGLFTNAEVHVRFLPAPTGHGLVFERTDLPGQPRIPARIEFLAAEERRTKLESRGASVEMTEHLLAALAGLQIDNCLIQLTGPELPGVDGSALPYVEALLAAGLVTQEVPRETFRVSQPELIEDAGASLTAEPCAAGLRIRYELNYGPASPIPAQEAEFLVTPEIFVSEIASARTFVLEKEIAYLRERGYGRHVTYQDLLVFGEAGPIENPLRAINECARHKLLDCLGDLALTGCDVQGQIRAFRTGHRHNHELARRIAALREQQMTMEIKNVA
jgi:UDP-3-O-[3-hydroxymyristoyl] N-acetylglucosamine deacetylase